MPGLQAEERDGARRLHDDGAAARRPVPSSPLGTSTASTGLPDALMAATTSAATPSSGRDRPAPNRASMIRSAPRKRCGRQRFDVAPPARGHRRGIAGQAARARPAARHAHGSPAPAAAAPPRSRRRRCCRARRATAMRRPGRATSAMAASATARPAASIRSRPGTPAAIASAIGPAHLLGGQQFMPGMAHPRAILDVLCRASCARTSLAPTARHRLTFGQHRCRIRLFHGQLPSSWASSAVAQGLRCPVDTHKTFIAWGICRRVNLGMRHA